MRSWDAERIADAAGGRVVAAESAAGGPERAVIDSRAAGPGALFAGLAGTRVDGGEFAAAALANGCWGVLVAEQHAQAAAETGGDGAVIAATDPLAALQRLATAWRRELACPVIAITGSTGKTSTKDLTRALAATVCRAIATRENLNTEIGLPLTILEAPAGTELLVLELAMRGAGQIAELTAICDPDVGVIVNVGPVHVEQLGSVAAVAAAKAELITGLRAGATAIVPAGEGLLAPHLRADLATVTFGPGGDVDALPPELGLDRLSAHMRSNALAALAACRAAGIEPRGPIDVRFSAMRGQRIALADGSVVINDCYNANPMSMRAALDDLRQTASGRSVAVLGDMLELGDDELAYHEELGRRAADAGVGVLVTVGARARAAGATFAGQVHATGDATGAATLLPALIEPGDTILIKGSRGVGLEVVTERLLAAKGRR